MSSSAAIRPPVTVFFHQTSGGRIYVNLSTEDHKVDFDRMFTAEEDSAKWVRRWMAGRGYTVLTSPNREAVDRAQQQGSLTLILEAVDARTVLSP